MASFVWNSIEKCSLSSKITNVYKGSGERGLLTESLTFRDTQTVH